MKNYLYTFEIKKREGKEIDWREYTVNEVHNSVYIEMELRSALIAAKCGWDDLKYKVVEYPTGDRANYMVLYSGGYPERWIPIAGNSKGANLQVLGENIW